MNQSLFTIKGRTKLNQKLHISSKINAKTKSYTCQLNAKIKVKPKLPYIMLMLDHVCRHQRVSFQFTCHFFLEAIDATNLVCLFVGLV